MDKYHLFEAFFNYIDNSQNRLPYNIYDLTEPGSVELFMKMQSIMHFVLSSENMYVLNDVETFKSLYGNAINYFKKIEEDSQVQESFKIVLLNRLIYRRHVNLEILDFLTENDNKFKQHLDSEMSSSISSKTLQPFLYAIKSRNFEIAKYLLNDYDLSKVDDSQNKVLFNESETRSMFSKNNNFIESFFRDHPKEINYLSPEFIYIHTVTSFLNNDRFYSRNNGDKKEFFNFLFEKIGKPSEELQEKILSIIISHDFDLENDFYPFKDWNFNVNNGKALDVLIKKYDFSEMPVPLPDSIQEDDNQNITKINNHIMWQKINLYKDTIASRLYEDNEYIVDHWITQHMFKNTPDYIEEYFSFIEEGFKKANDISLFIHNEPLHLNVFENYKELILNDYKSRYANKFKEHTPEQEKNYLNYHIKIEEFLDNKGSLKNEDKKTKRL